jgi:LuxR family transcriptional regulator
MQAMSGVTPLLVRIAEAATIGAVWDAATGFFAGLGFSRANYGYTRFLTPRSIGDPDDALFLTTAGPDYARRYFSGGLYARTPAFKWAQTHSGACTWRWVREAMERGELNADELDALRQNAEMGIRAGITVSFPVTSTRAKGALGLIADPHLSEADVEEIFTRRRDDLLSVAHMMHLKIVQMPQTSRRRSLTSRQREALEWVADGKQAQDIALLMGVSPAMVEKHLRLAREALAVETTAQAVAKATILNMIFQRQPEQTQTAAIS